MSYKPRNFTASATLSAADADTICTVNAAAGLTLTLPAASGSGLEFDIYIGTTVTSNNVIIQVANASDVMAGLVMSAADAGDTLNGWETASTSDTITLNGTTKGGVKGDRYKLTDCATNLWAVTGWSSSTGTEATPFSAAV
jgi:hypothetical protein